MTPRTPLAVAAALALAAALPSTVAAEKPAKASSNKPSAAKPASGTDPLAAAQWGPAQVRAPQAWPTSTGRGAVIAIVDSGVDLDHPDLKAKLLRGATFLDCPGKGSCGDGDWESGPAERQATKSDHGTHVAGIAAAITGNGVGIQGVAPDAKVLPVKVLDKDGGSFDDIAKGIRFSADQGADVINLSLGALPGVQALTYTGLIADVQEAITYARDRGTAVVAAAGNDFVSICGTPAFDDGALCVASTDKREARSAFSNFAVKPGLEAVAAPGGSALFLCGEDVVSTVPEGTGRSPVCGYGTDYDEKAGTSMATPHVAGVAALLAAQGRSDDEVHAVLQATARQPVTGFTGSYDPAYGKGIVDAAAAGAAPRG